MPTEPGPARPQVWPAPQRWLHGWTAALVLIGFSIAWIMVALPFTQLLLKFRLYQAHKTIGLIVLLLVFVRLVLRARWRRPVQDEDLPGWQLRAAGSVHAVLYALLLAVPVLGYLTAATAPIGVPTLFLGLIRVPHLVGPDREWFAIIRPWHRGVAVALVLLACGHVTMAIHHHWRGRAILRRMWRG